MSKFITILGCLVLVAMSCTAYGSEPLISLQSNGNKSSYSKEQEKQIRNSVDKGITAQASFLYWQAKEDGLEYVQKVGLNVTGSPVPTLIEADNASKTLDFEWKPGFQVSLGYIFPQRQQWDVSLSWIHLFSKAHGSESVNPDTVGSERLQPTWTPINIGAFAINASAHWGLHYNIVDFALGKNYFFGDWFVVKPFLAVRGAWIDQKYRVNYLATQDLTTTYDALFQAKNDFKGGGLQFGTNLQWFFASQWSFVGAISASLVYGRFSVDERANGVINPFAMVLIPENIHTKHSLTRISPNLESKAGLQWQTFFNADRCRLSLAAFYNLVYWFRQNQMINTVVLFNPATQNSYVNELRTYGDLQLQGVSLEARIEF